MSEIIDQSLQKIAKRTGIAFFGSVAAESEKEGDLERNRKMNPSLFYYGRRFEIKRAGRRPKI